MLAGAFFRAVDVSITADSVTAFGPDRDQNHSAQPRKADIPRPRLGLGARGAREKNLTLSRNVRVQPCIRPLNAAVVAAGPDVIH